MAKTSLKEQKNDAKQIISELIRDSSSSINVIAGKFGFSRQKVWRVIKHLKENNTIWGFTAIVDGEKIGLKKYIVMVKWFSDLNGGSLISEIMSKSEIDSDFVIESSYFTHGSFDWLFVVAVEDVVELKRFCNRLYQIFSGFVSEIVTSEILVPVKVSNIDNPESKKRVSKYYSIGYSHP